MNKEPAVIIGAVIGVIEAGVVLAIALGVAISDPLHAAILGLAVALGTVAQVVLTRASVYSPESVREIATVAHDAGKDGAPLVIGIGGKPTRRGIAA